MCFCCKDEFYVHTSVIYVGFSHLNWIGFIVQKKKNVEDIIIQNC